MEEERRGGKGIKKSCREVVNGRDGTEIAWKGNKKDKRGKES